MSSKHHLFEDAGTHQQVNRALLRRYLTEHFNDSELRNLSFDLAIPYEDLGGHGKADKARELVAYADRHGKIEALLQLSAEERPNVNWSEVFTPKDVRKTFQKHLLLSIPEEWTISEKGEFYEGFVAELLRPMRMRMVKRINVSNTGVDLLVQSEDQPLTVLVGYRSHRDPLSDDAISNLLGNVALRRADAGWLFSVSDLNKEGHEQWTMIQNDKNLSRTFIWYSPDRTIEILIDQKAIIDPSALTRYFTNKQILGDWTLVVTPNQRAWLVQLIEDGLPVRFSVFDAQTSLPLANTVSRDIASLSPRFSALTLFSITSTSASNPTPAPQSPQKPLRAPVARVISGDSWDDLRPARPIDFVGRDDVINEIATFIEQVRTNQTSTRTFAVQAPSGWGKSSLILKLVDLAQRNKKITKCSLTAVDTRSATNSAFVIEAFRQSLLDAQKRRFINPENKLVIESLRNPLDSADVINAFQDLRESKACITLVFDQFEELFTKEDLFETFNAVRELSLDLDSRQEFYVLAFAWKTDVSLPQQHPAYHMWHQLGDRRRSFKVRAFGGSDIQKVITKAEGSLNRKLFPVLRARLVEQCQGLPWLLKKLLVHVLRRVDTVDSQYLLLERELDVELLFKEDLSILTKDQIRCLKYVATRSPVPVADVEDNFSYEITNTLINSHLLVRSGLNYVVYWDIFRDYLAEERVPQIPWARTFQRGPFVAVKALSKINELGTVTSTELAKELGLKEGSANNILSDLVALQLVEVTIHGKDYGTYKVASHLPNLEILTIAKHAQGQLKRHIVVRELSEQWERDHPMNAEAWYNLFAEAHPRTVSYTTQTVHAYANSFRDWLLFAGVLERRANQLFRPLGNGRQMGISTESRTVVGVFLGTSAPETLIQLLKTLQESEIPMKRPVLEKQGLRNAITDSLVLGVTNTTKDGELSLSEDCQSLSELTDYVKSVVLKQETVKLVADFMLQGVNDATELGKLLAAEVGASWKPASALRYGNGVRKYYKWATEQTKIRKL